MPTTTERLQDSRFRIQSESDARTQIASRQNMLADREKSKQWDAATCESVRAEIVEIEQLLKPEPAATPPAPSKSEKS